jgi:transposase
VDGQRRFHGGPCAPARRRGPACAARGAGCGGAPPNDNNPPGRPGREALGRSRGGLSTKIHLAADSQCRPVTWILTPGQHGDCPQFIPLLNQVRIARRGTGRPRTRPGRALADKAYSSAANRAYLRKRGIKAVIPVKEDQKKYRRAPGPGWRASACLRCGTLQGAQYRRALLFQAQAVPRRRHPL